MSDKSYKLLLKMEKEGLLDPEGQTLLDELKYEFGDKKKPKKKGRGIVSTLVGKNKKYSGLDDNKEDHVEWRNDEYEPERVPVGTNGVGACIEKLEDDLYELRKALRRR